MFSATNAYQPQQSKPYGGNFTDQELQQMQQQRIEQSLRRLEESNYNIFCNFCGPVFRDKVTLKLEKPCKF